MRKLLLGCALLAAAMVITAQAPSVHVSAEQRLVAAAQSAPTPSPSSGPAKPAVAASKVDTAKEADIRQLMEVTGVNSLGDQLMTAGIAQFRASVMEARPDDPRAKQFADAFAARFQKHFDPHAVIENVIPIYDKHLSTEDLRALLEYYKSPFGQRMLKVLPEVARDSQLAGFSVGQKAADEALDDLKAEYPEFVSAQKDDEKKSTPEQ
jgi:uncharacterized protein